MKLQYLTGFVLLVVAGLSGCTYHTLFPSDISQKPPAGYGDLLPRTKGKPGPQAEALDKDRAPLPAPLLEVTPEVSRELAAPDVAHLVRVSLDKGRELLPVVRSVLQEEGLPEDLLGVAIIESAMRSDARSPAGAVGLWQLMKSTARIYGLEVNLLRDDRTDPVLSSIAAARHLRELYLLYRDWHFAVAAYNAGTGSINGAISRHGPGDFWTLARAGRVSAETSRFVSRFVAASLLVKKQTTGIMQARQAVGGKTSRG